MPVEGGHPGKGGDIIELGPTDWRDVDENESRHETDPITEPPTADKDSIEENPRPEIESLTVDYINDAYNRSKEEIASRYKIEQGNSLSRFIKKTMAVFAGEYSDLEISKDIANASPEEQEKELKKAFRLFGRDGALRLGKVGVKTGVAGGIGAGIAAALGGTIGSPIFLAALAGGAATRGAFELYRHFKKDEREGRAKVIESRAKVFSEAARFQEWATALISERETADAERVAQIDKELAEIHKHFIDLTNFESYSALYEEGENEQQLEGLAETQKLGFDKMRLEKKREKLADWAAFGGSLSVGIGSTIHSLLQNMDVEKVSKVLVDLDMDGVKHFVEKINPSDISSAEAGFEQQLEKSGGFVFHYNNTAMAEHGVSKAAELTTAILKDGSEVHVLPGLSDELFRKLALNSPEVAERAAAIAGSFWKEAVPVAGAQLISLVNFLSSVKREKKSEVQSGVNNTDSVNETSSVKEGSDTTATKEEESEEKVKDKEKEEDIKTADKGKTEVIEIPKPAEEIIIGNEIELPKINTTTGKIEIPDSLPKIRDWFNWLDHLTEAVSDDALEAAGVDLGASYSSDEVYKYIRLVDDEGNQHIFGKFIPKDDSKIISYRFFSYDKDNKLISENDVFLPEAKRFARDVVNKINSNIESKESKKTEPKASEMEGGLSVEDPKPEPKAPITGALESFNGLVENPDSNPELSKMTAENDFREIFLNSINSLRDYFDNELKPRQREYSGIKFNSEKTTNGSGKEKTISYVSIDSEIDDSIFTTRIDELHDGTIFVRMGHQPERGKDANWEKSGKNLHISDLVEAVNLLKQRIEQVKSIAETEEEALKRGLGGV